MNDPAVISRHIHNGVNIIDPNATYISNETIIETGVTIYPNAVLEGTCHIKAGASIGVGAHLINTQVNENARILSYSVLTDVNIGVNAQIGPFAYLRADASIGEACRIGSFVEVKNSKVGNKTSAAHLAYIGDAQVGNHVNIGCGVITANYDGKKKSQTTINDHAFIGSNVNLIAPITVGEGAFVAAGSTINKDLPAESFAIARVRQEVKENWQNDPRK